MVVPILLQYYSLDPPTIAPRFGLRWRFRFRLILKHRLPLRYLKPNLLSPSVSFLDLL